MPSVHSFIIYTRYLNYWLAQLSGKIILQLERYSIPQNISLELRHFDGNHTNLDLNNIAGISFGWLCLFAILKSCLEQRSAFSEPMKTFHRLHKALFRTFQTRVTRCCTELLTSTDVEQKFQFSCSEPRLSTYSVFQPQIMKSASLSEILRATWNKLTLTRGLYNIPYRVDAHSR